MEAESLDALRAYRVESKRRLGGTPRRLLCDKCLAATQET